MDLRTGYLRQGCLRGCPAQDTHLRTVAAMGPPCAAARLLQVTPASQVQIPSVPTTTEAGRPVPERPRRGEGPREPLRAEGARGLATGINPWPRRDGDGDGQVLGAVGTQQPPRGTQEAAGRAGSPLTRAPSLRSSLGTAGRTAQVAAHRQGPQLLRWATVRPVHPRGWLRTIGAGAPAARKVGRPATPGRRDPPRGRPEATAQGSPGTGLGRASVRTRGLCRRPDSPTDADAARHGRVCP